MKVLNVARKRRTHASGRQFALLLAILTASFQATPVNAQWTTTTDTDICSVEPGAERLSLLERSEKLVAHMCGVWGDNLARSQDLSKLPTTRDPIAGTIHNLADNGIKADFYRKENRNWFMQATIVGYRHFGSLQCLWRMPRNVAHSKYAIDMPPWLMDALKKETRELPLLSGLDAEQAVYTVGEAFQVILWFRDGVLVGFRLTCFV